MKGIIYIATNLFNGKSYVGQTRTSLSRRMDQHFRDSTIDTVNHFHLALMQYGKSAFKWEVLDEFSGTKEDVIHSLNVAEEYHILKHRTFLDENGYNSTRGGYSSHVFAEAIKRRSKAGSRAKSILQYDIEGHFIKEFESISDVAQYFGCKSIGTSITKKPWRGYLWRFRDGISFPREIEPYIKPRRCSNVIAYKITGEFYKEYESIRKCCKDLGKQFTVREFDNHIRIRSYLNETMLVFRKRDPSYPSFINVEIVYPKGRAKSDYISDLPVLQYTIEGKYIREFPSIIQAHRETGISEKSIRDWCNKSTPLTIRDSKTKYVWRFKRDDVESHISILTRKEKEKHKREHRIVQCDMDGNIIKVWDNIYQASLQTGISNGVIKKLCEGVPTRKKTQYLWRHYKGENIVI